MGHGPIPSRTRSPKESHLLPHGDASAWSYGVLRRLSAGYPPARGTLPVRYSPFRRATRSPKGTLALDLHGLATPPAFVLSQDQTLHLDIVRTQGHRPRAVNPHIADRLTEASRPAGAATLGVRSMKGCSIRPSLDGTGQNSKSCHSGLNDVTRILSQGTAGTNHGSILVTALRGAGHYFPHRLGP